MQSAVLAQFKTNVTARWFGSVNVIFIHFSARSLALVNSVLDVLHISFYVKPHCVIKALLSFLLSPPLTHTQTHKQCTPNIKLHYFIANL